MNPKQENTGIWLNWFDHERLAGENMAIDELLYRQCCERSSAIVRFYGWTNPAISIGYFQRYDAALAERTVIVRRCTGGGTVFHENDITYSLIVPSNHQLYQVGRSRSYRIITEVIVSALAGFDIPGEIARCNCDSIGKPETSRCFDSPVMNDVVVAGRKVAGAAQKRNRFGLLHQGSIKASNLDARHFEKFKNDLADKFADRFNSTSGHYVPDETLLKGARTLVTIKYGNDSWNKKR